MQRIFVGDVQGCADELTELLARAADRFGDEFELWLVGDLVNRGPDNLSALSQVREREARHPARVYYVLGNHEVSLLRCWLGLRPVTAFDSFQDVLEDADADDWMEWLRARPLVCSGVIGRQPFAMVHAAVHPDWSLRDLERAAGKVEERLRGPIDGLPGLLEEVEPPGEDVLGRLTRCRSVDSEGRWSSQEPAGAWRAWHRAWSERAHGYGIVYGHWAMQGLHVAPGLRGLDTGCVHHGRGREGALTAWLPEPDGRPFDLPDDRFWRVPARRAYYAHRDAQP